MSVARAVLDDFDDDDLVVLAKRLRPFLSEVDDGCPLSSTDAARMAGVSPKTIRRALDAGTLHGERVAGRWQTTADDVRDWRARGGPTHPHYEVTNGRRKRSSSAAEAIRNAGVKGR